MKKKGTITQEEIVTWIIVILVGIVILWWLFGANIQNWIYNLPGYNVPKEDVEIDISGQSDVETSGVCSGQNLVGKINVQEGNWGSKEQYIYINNEKTNLYWYGDDKNAELKFLAQDNIFGFDWFKQDIVFATVNDRVVKIDPKFFDLDSLDYHRIRFLIGSYEDDYLININGAKYSIPHSIFLLDGAKYYSGNLLCKKITESVVWKGGFYLDFLDKPVVVLNLKDNIKKGEQIQIFLDPYITRNPNKDLNSFYLEDEEEYIDIRGDTGGWSSISVGRVYPDNSFWLSSTLWRIKSNKLDEKNSYILLNGNLQSFDNGVYCFGDFCVFGRTGGVGSEMSPFWETNLKINFNELKNILK